MYTEENIEVLDAANVNISFQEQHKQLQLLDCDWLSKIRLNWEELQHIDHPKLTLAAVLEKHSRVYW